MEIELPKSYSALPWEQIKVSHVPASSPTPTKVIMVALYRPNNHNAFTVSMAKELAKIFQMLDIDDRVKAIVLTGHGRMFCAGADLDVGFPVDADAKGNRPLAQDHRDR